MNISYHWLKDLVETELTAGELAARLTGIGLAVDTVHEFKSEDATDYVLEIDVTSNRPDCLSHLGVAREVAVLERGGLRWREPRAVEVKNDGRVEVEDTILCPRYAARIVRGVRIKQSPAWLIKRLEAIGQRGINNVADITNYVLHELGQPLHAFDVQRLSGEKIIVRRAVENEKITTLDGVERTLDAQMLVIADAEKPVAIAGVMGGAASGVTEATTDVLIESAYFEPSQVRRTASKLNLHTEAANHFERGVDAEGTLHAMNRCAEMIIEMAGGVAEDFCIDINHLKIESAKTRLRFVRVGAITGLEVEATQADEILNRLGFKSTDKKATEAIYVAPSWRTDIEREEDLVEEVIRHTGIDNVPSHLPPGGDAGGEYLPGEKRVRAVREALTRGGYTEAISFSFVDSQEAARYEALPTLLTASSDETASSMASRIVTLENPVIENKTAMRTTLLAGLIEAVKHNLNHGTRNVKLFEIGRVFVSNDDSLNEADAEQRPVEREALAVIATGANQETNRYGATRNVDFFDLKGALESLTEAMKTVALGYAPADFKHLQKGRSAKISINGESIGSIGRLAPAIEVALKIKQPVFVAELDFQRLSEAEETPSRYSPLARFPSVTRDVSFIVKRDVTFQQMRASLLNLNVDDNRDIVFVDAYEGKKMPDGFRSLTLRAVYANDQRTLRDEEVDAAHNRLIQKLIDDFGAKLRA